MKILRYPLLFIILFILSTSLIRNILDYQKKYEFYQSYKQANEKEKKNNITLKTAIRKQDSQTELEKTIRNQLNLSKQNEVVIMIPTPTPSPIIITPTLAPNWKQWLDIFFK